MSEEKTIEIRKIAYKKAIKEAEKDTRDWYRKIYIPFYKRKLTELNKGYLWKTKKQHKH